MYERKYCYTSSACATVTSGTHLQTSKPLHEPSLHALVGTKLSGTVVKQFNKIKYCLLNIKLQMKELTQNI